MTALLELREKLKAWYSRGEVFIQPIVKFLLAFIVLSMLNSRMGYMHRIDSSVVVLLAALMCSFLPKGCIVLFGALFSLLHMYALSFEVAVVGLVVYLLLFLLFMRLVPKVSVVLVLTPLLCTMKMPYIMPIAMGLLGGPSSAVAVGCGVVVYYLLATVTSSAPTINTMAEGDITAKFRLMIDALLDNKVMLVMAAAFAITVLVVCLLRRMSIDHSWTIAMIAGAMINLMILLVGDLIYETNISVLGAVFGNLLALAVAKVLEFFRFCVDYGRTERVQFEDDEYYYYVKAIPKMKVTAPTKTVKRINAQRRSAEDYDYEREDYGEERSVVTERTQEKLSGYTRRTGVPGSGRSVTISGRADDDDYKELY